MFLLKIVVAIGIAFLIIKVGVFILKSLATPLPKPPPPGELRKVKLLYRCELCGAEVRMTTAAEENPEAPRHCMEDMELIIEEE
ncbi:MAG: hypothetical protein ACJZ17_06585 [Acidimicrobiales bacterium]|tara:strand:+ start:251 stop:502 length:252 start_codon:yes stop_codon:yes gene_type:complete